MLMSTIINTLLNDSVNRCQAYPTIVIKAVSWENISEIEGDLPEGMSWTLFLSIS